MCSGMRPFFPMLHLKIAGGYILLLALLCAVVFLVRLEHGKMGELDSREHSAYMRRKAVNRTFEKLLEFSFHDHLEKPLNFDPFGHAELSLLAKI